MFEKLSLRDGCYLGLENFNSNRTEKKINLQQIESPKKFIRRHLRFSLTRGHARFARSPLVIRLGDSRIRQGDSSYREVLSLAAYVMVM